MWGCMFAGDLAIKNIQKKVIAIIGDTRIGKSTLFNYILKIPLIGV
jgi:GTPase Era involved in 16S rRNA processing